jgi:hypothetical protein
LLLIGSEVIAAAATVLAALENGAMPLGSLRAPFEMVEAGWVDGGGRFYPAIDGVLPGGDFLLTPPSFEKRAQQENGRIELVFHTPVEITHKHGCYLREPGGLTFELLTKRLFKRCQGLAQWCGMKPESVTAKELRTQLIQRARSVEMVEWQAHWRRVNLRTHPGRHKGGLVGAFVYQGDIASFLPLLDAATVLGLGKNTTHGFGQLSYRIRGQN